MTQTSTEIISDFTEEMGIRFQEDQMPRIAGRILGLLMIEAGPFSFGELATRLKVSRASISTNSRLLSNAGIISRVSKQGDRQDYYKLSANPLGNLMEIKLARMLRHQQLLEETIAKLPEQSQDSRLRLVKLANSSGSAITALREFLLKNSRC